MNKVGLVDTVVHFSPVILGSRQGAEDARIGQGWGQIKGKLSKERTK